MQRTNKEETNVVDAETRKCSERYNVN